MTIEGLKNQFVESNKALDMVQKGLNDYLETKRSPSILYFWRTAYEFLNFSPKSGRSLVRTVERR